MPDMITLFEREARRRLRCGEVVLFGDSFSDAHGHALGLQVALSFENLAYAFIGVLLAWRG